MTTPKGIFLPVASLILLLFMALSCKQPDAQVQVPIQDVTTSDIVYPTSPIDTSLRLTFTSGLRAILEDSHGNTWFGSHNEGLALYDGKKMTFFTTEDGLSDNQVRSIYEDVDGTVWFECGIGISRYSDGKLEAYTKRNYTSKANWQAGENDLWFKSDEMHGFHDREGAPGVYRYDGTTLNFHAFSIAPDFLHQGSDFSYSVSAPFVKDQNGKYWIGTYGSIFGYDGKNFEVINDRRLHLNDQTGHLHVRNLFVDSQNNLWIGNNGIGAWRYDGKEFVNFSQLHGLVPNPLLNRGGTRSPAGSMEHVFAIGEDQNGHIWFGDRDTGAWRFDGEKMTNYTQEDGLTTVHIWQVYNSESGELWFAMGDGSVCRFNGSAFERVF